MSAALPRMPACKFKDMQYQRRYIGDVYTRDQMQAYATAARADLETENKRLMEALFDIGQYTGDGPATTPWRDIVKACGEKARAALKEQP